MKLPKKVYMSEIGIENLNSDALHTIAFSEEDNIWNIPYISVEALKEWIDSHAINDYRYGESYMDADEFLKFIADDN